ncbi:polyketide synthase [Aureococcus anophagefferens]|nr:polyketide synthase [Aureococcus anophagefferens]
MPDDAMGERVKAVVVKQDESLTAAALRRHAAAKLADFKVAKAALKKRDAKLAEERKAARASRKQAAQPPSGIADHVYGVTWVDAPLAAEAAAAVEGFWVLLDDGTGVAQELAAKMTGATAAILPPPGGAAFEQEKARVACALEESGEDVAGVVCLTALGAGAALGDDVAGATKAALKTLRAPPGPRRATTAPRVVVATRGAADDASSTASRRRRPTPRSPDAGDEAPRLALAGVVDDGAAPALTWDRFADVLKPKVDGSLHLHAASLKTPVDTFVLFSSIYGLLGSRAHALRRANAFQDGLAAARARAGLPALAVSWGTWADAGMAHRFGSGFEAHVKSTGMRFVPLDGGFQALAALSQVAGRTQCHAAVLPADWAQYAKRRGAAGPHPPLDASRRAAPARRARRGPPRELAAAAPADRAAMLASRVAAHVAEMMEWPRGRAPSVAAVSVDACLREAAVFDVSDPGDRGAQRTTPPSTTTTSRRRREAAATRRPGAANERPPCARPRAREE